MPLLGYDDHVRATFPALVSATLHTRLAPDAPGDVDLTAYLDQARALLDGGTESDLPQIQAWRRAFSTMGLKPTQYRCASEALLRRLRTSGDLPRVNPLVDLCNAVSVAAALPVAALDLDEVAQPLVVRPATGQEVYDAFSGELEHPAPGEVVFADAAGRAHARRWTHRQSARSAVRPGTRDLLVVCEGLHDGAAADVRQTLERLRSVLGGEVEVVAGDRLR